VAGPMILIVYKCNFGGIAKKPSKPKFTTHVQKLIEISIIFAAPFPSVLWPFCPGMQVFSS